MAVINTRFTVAPDGAISTATPLAAGEYVARIVVPEQPQLADDDGNDLPVRDLGPWPGKPFAMDNFPVHEEPWDNSTSLRREDMYDDEGRLR